MEKIYGKHKPLTDEMIQDLSKMCDQDFMEKWNTSRQYPIRARKKLGIKSFTNKHGTVEHKFENGNEYKWCGSGEHWKLVSEFGIHSSRWDGLRSSCKECEKVFPSNNTERKPWNTRKHNSIRRKAFVSWTRRDEERIYAMCGNSCAYCKTPILLKNVEFDHFVPVKLGGKTEPKNMLPSCSSCNRGRLGKYGKEPHAWLVQKFGQHFGEMIYQDCVSILEKLK